MSLKQSVAFGRLFQKGFEQCGSSARSSGAGRDQCAAPYDPSVFAGDSTAALSSRSTILSADIIPVAIR